MSYISSFLTFALSMLALFSSAQTTRYKCLIQMSNYMGEGAYIAISLINPQGDYEKTMYVLGADKKWYSSLKEWHKFNTKKPANINAITGASVTGGERTNLTIELEDAKINKGFKLRFESAVEDQKYQPKDVEVPLTTEALNAKTDGKGFIRFVRFAKM
ncbi:DUF2271 domain-containing protein [Pedobacter chinensis]|uniref:DUF2271 domain-containing protein n=1 Tax=Pedobacter chinensis TaxID=2282421 RepID=A0A369PVZ9_9SPHI|nr:DUF2271 domain-containing protein [Pedobacter chinensis]RDC55177.1 DUF2271 domain-containing protein [Pedobacter chinensis]